MSNTPRYTLGKTERLKSRKAIEQLFKGGKSFSLFPFRILYSIAATETNNLQSGFSASAKRFKKAVDRNRIKRLIREAYRLQKNDLQIKTAAQSIQLHIFFIYVGNELPEYDVVFEKMTAVLKRLTKIIDENGKTNS